MSESIEKRTSFYLSFQDRLEGSTRIVKNMLKEVVEVCKDNIKIVRIGKREVGEVMSNNVIMKSEEEAQKVLEQVSIKKNPSYNKLAFTKDRTK